MKNRLKGCMMHETDNWKTPKKMYNYYMKQKYIDCFKYNSTENEYENNYYKKKLFVNPPYSQMDKVTDWLIDQYKNECEIVLLVPARTDTKWFHRLLKLQPLIYFIKGRLKFNESKNGAPFPSLLIKINQYKTGYWEELDQEIYEEC